MTGSASAFESLIRRHQPRLLAFLSRSLGNRHDAEDLTQTVFLTIHQTADRFREGHSFATWMYMIARRKAIDFHRKSGTRSRALQGFENRLPAETADIQDPSTALEGREQRQDIWNWARRHLSEKAFTALWLHTQEDLSLESVARSLGLTRTHTRVILHRARKALIQARTREDLNPSKSDPSK